MKHLAALLLLAAAPLLLAQNPVPGPAQQKPAPEKPQEAPPPKATPENGTPSLREKPLTALPYTPSLDIPSMDRTANPCNDFYQYTCGGWRANNPIPADQASWSVYGKLADENSRYLWGVLDELSKPGSKRTVAQQQIGDYFASCMNVTAINDLGAKPLRPLLAEIDALSSRKAMAPFLAAEHLRSNGRRFLFGFGSDQDFGDATQVIASVGAGGLILPDRDFYTKEDAKSKDIRAKYLLHVQKMMELVGETPAKAKNDAETVLRMETALATPQLTRVERRNPYNLYHKMSPAELEKLAPNFDWPAYLAASGVAGVTVVNVDQPKYFTTVNQLLNDLPLSDWKTYLKWHAVASRASFLSAPFVTESFNFNSGVLRGVKAQPPRWKRCVRAVDNNFGDALGQEFVSRTFTPETKARTLDMTKRIEAAMEGEIKGVDWMTDETKTRALEKLHAIANKIGYPDHWLDYSTVRVNRNDYIGNTSRATLFESKRQLAKIGKPLDRGEWGITPPTVNAYYSTQMNDINFPAGVLQPPLFDPKMDDAPNYGNTGSTIGHELTHAFDDEGRQFDAQGNLKDWWTEADAKKFEERVNCVRSQYAGYTIVDDIKINSKLTSGEDVADLGGTLLAYIAWRDATANQKLQTIDGFTPDQRFFIGFAQWACENQRPENQRLNAVTNEHSPGKYRINSIVSDLPQFAQAFGCTDGSPMVQGAKACKVW
jgi:putative endopeptidase